MAVEFDEKKFDKKLDAWIEEFSHDPAKRALFLYGLKLGSSHEVREAIAKKTRLRPLKALPLARGREPKTSQPTKDFDWHQIVSPTWNREKVIIQLHFLNTVLDAIEKPYIVTPGKETIIPEVKEKWATDHELRGKVREFKQALEKALHAYNKQLTVNALTHAFEELHVEMNLEGALPFPFEAVDKARDIYRRLDTKYYEQGNLHFGHAGALLKDLSGHETGKLFLLKDSEMKEALQARRSRPHREY